MTAILWDLFGVLLPHQTPEAFGRFAAALEVSPDVLWPAYRGGNRRAYDAGLISAEAYWTSVGNDVGKQLDWRLAVRADLDSWKGAPLPSQEIVRKLAAAGVRQGILSNLPADFVEPVLSANPWLGELDSVTFSCQLRLAKPDPRIYAAALDALGEQATDVFYVDDSPGNVQAARNLGMVGYHVGGSEPEVLRSELRPLDEAERDAAELADAIARFLATGIGE